MLKVNVDEILKKIPDYEKALQASARTLKDSVNKAKTAANKQTRTKYTVTASRIREAEKISVSSTDATVTYKSRMVNMINFKVTPKRVSTGKGKKISAGVKKGGSVVYKRAFIQNVNGLGVWRRTTDKRMPIAPVYGPAISHLMNNDDTKKAFTETAQETYTRRMEHHIMRAMR